MEFHCHGGETTASAGSNAALNWARPTQRRVSARVYQRQESSNAEGKIDLIDAESRRLAQPPCSAERAGAKD
ncbi:MAG: hypothetical protein ACLTSK_03370 [Christensenellales bacterium]